MKMNRSIFNRGNRMTQRFGQARIARLDRDVAEARAKEMGMRVAAVPMPDYGDVLPSREPPAWNGCPPGWTGGGKAPL